MIKIAKQMLAAAVLLSVAASASAYDFVISNQTGSKITAVHASEDGKNWGSFNIGSGIPAGKKTKITWSSETDNSGCEWQVKAAYADGSESEAAPFDFCEEDLELEFTE